MTELRIDERIQNMEKCCLSLATGGKDYSYEAYESAREDLMSESAIAKSLPDWLINCRYGSQFWTFIKENNSTYQGRREFLRAEFSSLLDHIERFGIGPTSLSIRDQLTECTSDSVHEAWQKCYERRNRDFEGAITSARTPIESTCKHILENLGEIPDDNGDLPRLYKQTAKAMNLSPDQHHEQIFKQILSGCGTVVEGLGSLRNKFGDAHGQGSNRMKPTKRHAELAVNLAGSLCSFLIATYEENCKGKSKMFPTPNSSIGNR
jgi:hypothetical protein